MTVSLYIVCAKLVMRSPAGVPMMAATNSVDIYTAVDVQLHGA